MQIEPTPAAAARQILEILMIDTIPDSYCTYCVIRFARWNLITVAFTDQLNLYFLTRQLMTDLTDQLKPYFSAKCFCTLTSSSLDR